MTLDAAGKPSFDVLEEAAAGVEPHLPIHARVSSLRLVAAGARTGDSWTTLSEFPLG